MPAGTANAKPTSTPSKMSMIMSVSASPPMKEKLPSKRNAMPHMTRIAATPVGTLNAIMRWCSS